MREREIGAVCFDRAAPAFAGRDESAVFEDGFALARAADKAGFDAVWVAEHHFLGDYSHAAAPDMLLAAIARGRCCRIVKRSRRPGKPSYGYHMLDSIHYGLFDRVFMDVFGNHC